MIEAGRLQPQKLINQTISLEEATTALPAMDQFSGRGITVINRFWPL
jgi:alcohol dehydrogenase